MDSEDMRVALVHFPPLLRSISRFVASVIFLGSAVKAACYYELCRFPLLPQKLCKFPSADSRQQTQTAAVAQWDSLSVYSPE